MLKAIWVDQKDEELLAQAMVWYCDYYENYRDPFRKASPEKTQDLYRVRELANRIKRGAICR